jgi:hypothetical protein
MTQTLTVSASAMPALTELHTRFQGMMPTIRKHATFAFRNVRCRQTQADKISETIALCWRWTCRLARRGKDASRFAAKLALRASQAVRAGRRVTRSESPKCPLSERCQHMGRANVISLPQHTTFATNSIWMEALIDNTQTPVDEQVIFRLDLPRWLLTWDERSRRLITDMAASETTSSLAAKYGVSPGAISQRRRIFQRSWRQFNGE